MCRRRSFTLVSPWFLLLVFASRPGLGHDHTRQQFARQRALARAETRRNTEPAPRALAGEKSCRLAIELVLDGGRPVAGLVRVTNLATGRALSFADQIQRDASWHAVAGPATLEVPPVRLRIEAVHGLHTEMAVREIDLAGQEKGALRLTLKRFYDPTARGLKAGNTHLHLMRLSREEAVRYLRVVPQADALDLVFVSYLRRVPEDQLYISNTFTRADLARLSRGGTLLGSGEEHRHNFGPGGEGYGHVMFLDILKLIQPVSIGPGIMKEGTDGIPLQRGIRRARQDGATVIWCHNQFGHEDVPNWIAGLLHAQNIFDGGSQGSYDDTFYRYLNLGMKIPFSTGTDWFIYDFSRVYVLAPGEPTSQRWLAALAAGTSYITNGVFLELEADRKGIGETIAASAGQELRIVGRATGRHDFRRVELIHNGRVIHAGHARAVEGHFAAAFEHRLKVTEPGWVAIRIPSDAGKNELDKPLFAHTSPIHVELAGKRIFRPDVARELLAEMEQSRDFIQSQGVFANDEERETVLRVYRESISALQRRIVEQR